MWSWNVSECFDVANHCLLSPMYMLAALSFGSSEVLKQLVANGHTTSDALQDFMEMNFHHRQGPVQLFTHV